MLTGEMGQVHRKPKIVITDYDYGDVNIETEILEAAGGQVIAMQVKSETELADVAHDCFGMMNQYARIGAETIARMQQCRVIARYGVGVDIVDVEAASKKGILVTNVRDYCTEEVADHAIALWLTLARKLPAYDKATRAGVWQWQSGAPINRIRGRNMGIVSFGKIGQAIADRARAFGVELLVYDPYLSAEKISAKGARSVSKDELLRLADFLIMQAPMTDETRHFLSEREFEIMKPTAIVVNTGRGRTIDNKALYKALTENKIAAAGLDDPEEEPAKRASWSPDDNPIFRLPNVIVTPHAAYYSEESIQMARSIAANEVASILLGRKPNFPVNAEAVANPG
jgi:D-3-phosphoglycerate dehydrogenase